MKYTLFRDILVSNDELNFTGTILMKLLNYLKAKLTLGDILTAAFFVITFTFLGPLETIAVNINQVDYAPSDVWHVFFILSISIFLVIVFVFAILPKPLKVFVSAGIFGGTVIGYLQANFLNPNFGFINQTVIDWDSMRGDMTINWIVWFIVVVAIVVVALVVKKSRPIMGYAAGLLSAMQIVAAVSLMFVSNDLNAVKGFSQDTLTTISENENIFLFILDATSESALQEMEDTYPGTLDNYSDFTRFTNLSTYFYSTKPAAVMLATGYYDTKSLFEEHDTSPATQIEQVTQYYDDAWAYSDNYYGVLQDAGYISFIHPWNAAGKYITDFEQAAGKIENIEIIDKNPSMDYAVFLRANLSLTLFRYAPLRVKEFLIENFTMSLLGYTNFSEAPDVDHQKALMERMAENDFNYIDDNVFSTVHLMGSHPPYENNEFGEFAGVGEVTRAQQTKGMFYTLNLFIEELKNSGVYDDSTIIILADHGSYDFSEPGSYSSMLMIKQKNESHDKIIYNNAPLTFPEITPTIISQVNEDRAFEFGRTVYDVPENEVRERTIYQFHNNEDLSESCYHVYLQIDYEGDVKDLSFTDEELEQLPVQPFDFCLYCYAPF